MGVEIDGVLYTTGVDRNDPGNRKIHLYRGSFRDPGWPMCRHGWNRSNGEAYSILRNVLTGSRGMCETCWKRAMEGLEPVPPTPHPTKWI